MALPARRGPGRDIDRELLVRPAPQQTTLGHALNLLAGAAVRFRESFGRSDPVWSLIRFLRSRAASGRSTAAAAQLKFGFRRALPRPARPVTMQTTPA